MTILSGAVAILVLFFAWLLRRASKARERAALTARQTEALVGEKIRDIHLDLK